MAKGSNGNVEKMVVKETFTAEPGERQKKKKKKSTDRRKLP